MGTRMIAAGVVVALICGSGVAAPPLDRPTPPPCCADGHAWASPAVYGVFPTRWRRWPLEYAEQAPTVKLAPLPTELKPEVPPFEAPPAEQEDRKAPPPSTPRAEEPQAAPAPAPGPRGPGGAPPPTSPQSAAPGMQPRSLPYTQPALPTPPQTTPPSPPGAEGVQPSSGPLFKSIPPESPLNRSGPMGDLDPPPTLPFGPQPVSPNAPAGELIKPATMPISLPSTSRVDPPSNDPPPAPPVSLARLQD
jgi:hypothetical protein